MTRKEINSNFTEVISFGYCDAQNLLRGKNRIGYNTGKYGWNYDIYSVGDVAICTGYRGMPGRRVPRIILEEYEARARDVWENYYLTYDQQRAIVDRLLAQFVKYA